MRRRVILVNPKMCSPRAVRFPLSLLALGAALEERWEFEIIDGNVVPNPLSEIQSLLDQSDVALVAVTVMPGPQVAPAIEISSMVREHAPEVPIAWGGFFPTLYPDSAINAPYVDFVIRGQGEETLLELLDRLPGAGPAEIRGLTWKLNGQIVHNPDRPFRSPDAYPPYPYDRLRDVEQYLRPSFLGSRTAVHQAAIGCRYRCTFCGVVSMFNGHTDLQGTDRLAAALTTLRDKYGANAVQYYDHNFFDREETSVEILEVLAHFQLPWWCYARTDTLANFSTKTWNLIEKSSLKMTYVGAEAASDSVLKSMKKGTKVEHTFEVARRCRAHGVIPEFSFVLGGPEDPEGEIEKTFEFIKKLKAIHPTCEVILYFYSPTPQREPAWTERDRSSARIPVLRTYGPEGPALPTTPEEWTQAQWIDYVCHQDAPWLTPAIRQRVKDFSKVLYCRFPTVQDYTTPRWGKTLIRRLAGWRYATCRYGKPWELDLARRFIRLREPQRESI
ncbi:MAG: cobalamin-dependent protein [Acidobacteria bacterium]|nr:cobalamin-dependent protein [Acidobacteriota bacterium]